MLPPWLVDLLVSFLGDFPFLPTQYRASVASPFENAVGVIAQPGPNRLVDYATTLLTNPIEFAANLWGHTALYVRLDGRIVAVFGYDPDRLLMFTSYFTIARDVVAGRRATPAFLYSEPNLFASPDALIAEFRLTFEQALVLRNSLPDAGPASPQRHPHFYLYLTRSGRRLQEDMVQFWGNCLEYIRESLLGQSLRLLEARAGRAPRLISSSQGTMSGLISRGELQLEQVTAGGGRVVLQSAFPKPSRLVTISTRLLNLLRLMLALRAVALLSQRGGGLITSLLGPAWRLLPPVPSAVAGLLGRRYLPRLVSYAGEVITWRPPSSSAYLALAWLVAGYILETKPTMSPLTRRILAWTFVIGKWGAPLIAARDAYRWLKQ